MKITCPSCHKPHYPKQARNLTRLPGGSADTYDWEFCCDSCRKEWELQQEAIDQEAYEALYDA